jgi:hypothetical protein
MVECELMVDLRKCRLLIIHFIICREFKNVVQIISNICNN